MPEIPEPTELLAALGPIGQVLFWLAGAYLLPRSIACAMSEPWQGNQDSNGVGVYNRLLHVWLGGRFRIPLGAWHLA